MITVLTGENRFVLQQELQRIVGSFVAEHTDMALEQIDGEDAEFDRIREALQSMPFLASKKLVVLRNPGANKQFVESAESLLLDLSEVTDVVIVETKPDKRTAYYKFLKKHTDLKEFNELDTPQLAKWLATAAKEAGGVLSPSDASYLVNRVGTNQLSLQNELQKLLNYDKKITRESIDLLSERTPQSTTFDLLDAALRGDKAHALQLYKEQRSMKVEPQQIIALLGWQLHALAVVKTAGERDANQIASEAKLNPFVVRKTQSLARNMSLGKVKELVHSVRVLDERLKSESIDADEALQNLIISL
jgi:DNA polymerase III subunit delta